MTLNRAAADAALKEDYQPAIREQLHNINVILAQIEENDKDTDGRRAVLSLHVGRNQGVGARGEGGTLPDAGHQRYAEERVMLKRNYGRIQVTGPVIASMKSDRGSFTRAVDSEVKGIVNDLKRDVNRQVFGTSNGVIATTGSTTSDTTIVLATGTSLTQMRQFEVGMRVDIGTVANPTAVASGVVIEAVDRANATIDISGSNVSTTAGTHFVFRAASGGAGADQKEITGLRTIVNNSGSLFNVDPSATPVWASYVDSNSGTPRSPSDSLFERAIDEINIEGGSTPDLLVSTAGVSRAFANGLKDQKRFSGDPLTLKGGFKALSVQTATGELAFTWDRDCPAHTAFALSTPHLTHYVSSDWDWMDLDGAILNRVPNQDAYEATLYKYHELATDKRNAHGRIDDLAEA